MDELDTVQPIEIGAITGVGEGIQDDHAILRVMLAPIVHEIGADEAGAAGHEQIGHAVRSFRQSISSWRQWRAGPVMAQLLPLSSTLHAGRRAGVG